ncbi:MAG: hypothetical protein OEV44_00020 [Spirochaetota bacterium]|nr:hypothetical protein [Spirochaetota bacterium]
MTLYLAAILGALIYGGIDWISETGKNVLSKKYIFTTIINILAGCSLIWALELKAGQFEIAGIDAMKIIAMSFGIFGQKLFKALISMANKNIKTRFGINKK